MLPIDSTTIKTCDVILKVRISDCSVSTVFSTVTVQEYSTTTILSEVINKVTIILNDTMTTYPNHSTTISTTDKTTDVRYNITSSFIASEISITYSTIMPTPMYCTTTTTSSVVLKNRISYITISSTCTPI